MITAEEKETLDGLKKAALSEYGRFAGRRPQSSLAAINEAGALRVEEIGFPHRTDEMFTYVNTIPVSGAFFAAKESTRAKEARNYALPEELGSSVVTVTNGNLDGERTDVSALGRAVAVKSLAVAVAEDCIIDNLIASATDEKDIFGAMNSAFTIGGASIVIEKGKTLKTPLLIVIDGAGAGSIAPRVMVDVGAHAEATLIFLHTGAGPVNGLTDINVGQGANVTIYQYHEGDTPEAWFNKVNVTQEKDSRVSFTGITIGGKLTRSNYNWRLTEPGASVSFANLAVTDGDEVAHHYARFYHEAPNCKSDIVWRNIADGKSVVSTDGTVIVNKGATGTDSDQQMKNLTLSSEAMANAKPNLMIYNDDVKCSHGNTVGQVDENQLLYFVSRGISKEKARAMLTQSFANVVTGRISYPPIAEIIRTDLAVRL